MNIIALTGRAGSGKDTAATILQFITSSFDTGGVSVEINDFVERSKTYTLRELNEMQQNHNGFQIAKFAYPVYQIAAIITGHETVEEVMTQKFKETTWPVGNSLVTGRQILQKVGKECFRDVFDQRVWIGILDGKINRSTASGIIISDLRYPGSDDEEGYVRSKNATIIKMVGRDGGVSTEHSSESGIDKIVPDYLVDNSGNYLYLASQLESICRELNILNCKYTWK